MHIVLSRDQGLKALENERSAKKVGAGLSQCLALRDLGVIVLRGFTPAQHRHVCECTPCRISYGQFMKIRRNEARMALRLDAHEDLVNKVFGRP